MDRKLQLLDRPSPSLGPRCLPVRFFTVSDIDIAAAMNTQPVTLKQVVPRLRDNDETLTSFDVSKFDNSKYYNDIAVTILSHELKVASALLRI